MRYWSRVPQVWRYGLELGLALTLSIGGVVIAVWHKKPAEGVLGGVFASIVAFATLLLRPDWGVATYEERKQELDADSSLSRESRLEELVSALEQWMYLNASGQSRQTAVLALATLIGTVFWAFGDSMAKWLLHTLGRS